MKQSISLVITILVSALAFQTNAGASLQVSKVQAKRHQTKVRSGVAGEVEADIYSGRKNPTWALSEKETGIVFHMLAGLPPAVPTSLDGGLGYRGFRVRKVGTLSKLPQEIRVCRGIAYDGVHFYKDADRQMERWILKSGKRQLGAKTYEYIKKEIAMTSK